MTKLIEIKTNENLEPIISGRELHEKLGVNSHYKDWIKRMLDYGFVENTDYIAIAQKRATAQGNETTYNDHILKLDMAKEICMLQRNEKGKQFRKYFIAVEKDFNSPEKVMARALHFANNKVKELENKIEQYTVKEPLETASTALERLFTWDNIKDKTTRVDYTEKVTKHINGSITTTKTISVYPEQKLHKKLTMEDVDLKRLFEM